MKTTPLSFEEIDPFVRFPHRFEVPVGSPLPPRAAYDYRIMYVYGGAGWIVVEGVRHEAARGTLFLWRPGVVYELLPGPDEGLSLIGVNFDFTQRSSFLNYPIPPENKETFQQDNVTELVEFTDFPSLNQTVILKHVQSAEQLLLDMSWEYIIRKKFYMHKIRGAFLLLLGDIARHAASVFTGQEGSTHKVDLILEYIREHHREPLTNKQIGEHFRFHPVYINRLMVQHTGTSLHQYLINYRISLAINLLQDSIKSVSEIAYEVGFKDVNHFSKCFKNTVGLSPRQYTAASRYQGD